MSNDLIRFDVMVQDALRSVVRRALSEVERAGLPGDHHFFISFDTTHPGVRISKATRQRFPENMTIVLQHQFWDLKVSDTGFEVGLSFGGVPEKLIIPFHAIKGFFDPSVQFGLQFDAVTSDDAASGETSVPETVPAPTPAPAIATVPPAAASAQDVAPGEGAATVISLDKFRKKT